MPELKLVMCPHGVHGPFEIFKDDTDQIIMGLYRPLNSKIPFMYIEIIDEDEDEEFEEVNHAMS